MHQAGDVALGAQLKAKVDLIRKQAVREELDSIALLVLKEQLEIRQIIVMVAKELTLPVPSPGGHVIQHVLKIDPRQSRHRLGAWHMSCRCQALSVLYTVVGALAYR
jgi:hypothetical protein